MVRNHALVVEPDRGVRELVGEALSSEGWDVDLAATGVEAVELATRHFPDLLLLDVTQISPRTARSVIEHLGLGEEDLPVLAYGTGRREPWRVADVGALRYLPIPLDASRMSEMVAEVDELLARRRRMHEQSPESRRGFSARRSRLSHEPPPPPQA
jgi:DNA-binding response OmpR family regulator